MEALQLDHSHHRAQSGKLPICFLAHDVADPLNIGSLFRIADALGVERIFLSGSSAVPPDNKIKKTSRSTEKYVDFLYQQNPKEVIAMLRQEGYRIISLEITSNSIDLRQFAMSVDDKICLVLGSENKGVPEDLLEISDQSIHIPMLGRNSSMNVATACSIATFEFMRRLLP